MNKTQLYRGYSSSLKKWVYGVFFKHCIDAICCVESDDNYVAKIITDEINDWGFPYSIIMYDVDKDSVQRCTNFTLASSKTFIYEEDIVELFDEKTPFIGVVKYGEYENPFDNNIRVGFYIEWEDKNSNIRKDLEYWAKYKNIKYIGNTYKTN